MRVNLKINSGQSGPLYAGFTRLQNFPLDSDSVKGNLTELKEYLASGGNAYNGQIISVLGDGKDDRRTYIVRDITADKFEDAIVEVADGTDIIEINNTIDNKIKEVNESINAINSDLDAYKESNRETIEVLEKKVDDNKAELDDGLSAIRASVGENKKLIEANQKAIEDSKKELQANIDKTVEDLKTHIENYNQTKNTLDKTISDLAAATGRISSLEEAKTELSGKIGNLETWKGETSGKISVLETTQKQLSDKTAALETWKANTDAFLTTVCTKDYFTEEIQKVDLKNYYKKSEIDSLFDSKLSELENGMKSEITKQIQDALKDLTDVMRYMGSKNTYSELPTDGNRKGDIWNVKEDGMNYAWDGTSWDAMGSQIKLDGYATEDWVRAQGYSKLTESDVRAVVNDMITAKLTAYKTSEDIAKEYYSKAEVDQKIADIASGGTIDLSNYYNKEQADEKFVPFSLEKIRGGNATSWKKE